MPHSKKLQQDAKDLPLVFVYYLTLLEGSFLPVGLPGGIVIAALAALAVLEILVDKGRAVERVFNYVMVPVRAASGALVFALVSGAGAVLGEMESLASV